MDEEREKRGKGCNFILQVGIALKLPQLTLSTASTFLHRFYMRHSVQKHHYYDTGATALYLATKVEENMRKFEQLITECVRVAQKNPTLVVDKESKEFWKWRDVIIEKEELLLEAICFDMTFEQPYTLLISFTHILKCETRLLMKTAWSFVNDSYMTMLCLLFPSRTIAAAALYCAAKHCKVEFEDQDNKPWWEIIGVKIKDIKRACNYMASVYENNPLRNDHGTVRYVSTPESGESNATRARSQKTPDISPTYSSQQTYSNGSRGSSIETGSIAGKRMREGSEEGEEVSTPVKKQKMGGLLASPDSSHSRDSETQRGDGSTGRPESAGGRSEASRETNGNSNGNGNGWPRDRKRSSASPLLWPRSVNQADEDLSEEGEVV